MGATVDCWAWVVEARVESCGVYPIPGQATVWLVEFLQMFDEAGLHRLHSAAHTLESGGAKITIKLALLAL